MSQHETEYEMTEAERAEFEAINRREAVRRVGMMLGGVAGFVGGARLLDALGQGRLVETAEAAQAGQPARGYGVFTARDIAFLDEVADTILPTTAKSPGAKAARTGRIMAVMVNDSYYPNDQKIFRDGMKALDAASRAEYKVGFVAATPRQRTRLLERLDREAKEYTDRVNAMRSARDAKAAADPKEADKFLPDQRQENSKTTPDANPAPAITADSPAHYFRMMKELAMLGYFTSKIGMEQAQRYVESPGRFDPCVPYRKGDRAWAGHA